MLVLTLLHDSLSSRFIKDATGELPPIKMPRSESFMSHEIATFQSYRYVHFYIVFLTTRIVPALNKESQIFTYSNITFSFIQPFSFNIDAARLIYVPFTNSETRWRNFRGLSTKTRIVGDSEANSSRLTVSNPELL